jgi:hypothetical protein
MGLKVYLSAQRKWFLVKTWNTKSHDTGPWSFSAELGVHTPPPPPVTTVASSAGIFKQSMGARNRVGIGLSHWPTRLHGLAELIPWNRFLGSLKVKKFGLSSFPFNCWVTTSTLASSWFYFFKILPLFPHIRTMKIGDCFSSSKLFQCKIFKFSPRFRL